MPDERQDSIRQGMGAPAESPSGRAAADELRQRAGEGPQIGGELGGTSDADSPADEAQANAARWAAEHAGADAPPDVEGKGSAPLDGADTNPDE